MDVLRKELDAFYESQHLEEESLDYSSLTGWCKRVETAARLEGDCRVITDAAADYCYIRVGKVAKLLGLGESDEFVSEADSSDEDVIYNRICPEDIVDKRILEYEFFKHIDSLPPERKLNIKASCHIRIRTNKGGYVFIDNSTRLLQLSPQGKVWLILCCYSLSPCQERLDGIDARLVDMDTGVVTPLHISDRRTHILTYREKEILGLIKEGKASKQIAGQLGISLHTVNRHRQNILRKLSVGNSVEAVTAATLMRLL